MARTLTVKPPVRQASLRNVHLWTRVSFTHRTWRKKRRVLSIAIKDIDTLVSLEFAVIAVEGPRTESTDVMVAAEEVLDDHQHKTLGSFPSERKAMRAAEEFGKQWLLGRALHRCSCLPPRKAKKP